MNIIEKGVISHKVFMFMHISNKHVPLVLSRLGFEVYIVVASILFGAVTSSSGSCRAGSAIGNPTLDSLHFSPAPSI